MPITVRKPSKVGDDKVPTIAKSIPKNNHPHCPLKSAKNPASRARGTNNGERKKTLIRPKMKQIGPDAPPPDDSVSDIYYPPSLNKRS